MSCTRYLLRERSFHRVRADRMATGSQSLRSRATRAAWDRHSPSGQTSSLPLHDLNRKGETPTPVSTSPDISDCWRLLQSSRQDRNSESTGIQLSDELRSLLVSILRLSRIEIRDHSDKLELPKGGVLSDYIGH